MKCDDRMLSDCEKPEAYAKLIFGFCFFHAVCQDPERFQSSHSKSLKLFLYKSYDI